MTFVFKTFLIKQKKKKDKMRPFFENWWIPFYFHRILLSNELHLCCLWFRITPRGSWFFKNSFFHKRFYFKIITLIYGSFNSFSMDYAWLCSINLFYYTSSFKSLLAFEHTTVIYFIFFTSRQIKVERNQGRSRWRLLRIM